MYSPRLRGAHRYTTRGGISTCALWEQSKTATELTYAEVISYNKKNLERELQNESRQQGKVKRREEEI